MGGDAEAWRVYTVYMCVCTLSVLLLLFYYFNCLFFFLTFKKQSSKKKKKKKKHIFHRTIFVPHRE